MLKRLLILCAFVLVAPQAWAQSPRAAAEQFLATVQRGQVAAAYAKLFEGSNISSTAGTGLAIRRQTESMLPVFGRILGYDLVEERQVAGSVTRLVYILKSEKHLTVWEFYFYRPGNRWFTAEVNFSDKLNLLSRIR